MGRIFCREISEGIETLIESVGEDGKKTFTINGTFMQAEVKNRNGRMYPQGVMESSVNRFVNEFVVPKRALGELGHPSGPALNLDRTSHIITEMHMDGSNVKGKAKIIDTPNGKIVKSFIEEGIKFGVSSRGVGSLRQKQGIMEVQNDFLLTAVDIVADPSAPEAFVDGLMENREWILENGIWIEKELEEMKEEIEKAASSVDTKKLQESKQKAFEKFIDLLSKD